MKYDVKKEKIAIHCPTKDLAKKVIDKFIELGVGHCDESNKNDWSIENEVTCFRGYTNDFGYDDKDYYQKNDYQIIPAQKYLDSFEWIPKRGEMVMTEFGERIFIADVGEQFENRYLFLLSGYEKEYLNGERVKYGETNSIQQIKEQEPTLDGKTALIDGKEYELKLIEK